MPVLGKQVEVDRSAWMLRDHVAAPGNPEISDGSFALPQGPGLGVTLEDKPWQSLGSSSRGSSSPVSAQDPVGSSKFFFDKYSTFNMFYLGAHQILNGVPSGNNQIQGYDCLSTGTQDMPPSWTDTTDPNVDFDTMGRVYQTMLPFNSFFDATKLHPDGEIDVSYSDDLGRTWVKGNGGVPLEPPNNASAKQLGHVEDKQWIAVNHIPGNKFQDHVYAAWAIFNGNGGNIKVRMAVSRDRGQTFDKAVTIGPPSEIGAAATFVYPAIDAAGNVFVSVVSFPPNGRTSTIYVARSTDDARTFGPFVPVATVTIPPGEVYPNTRFRSGIAESFAASPTYARASVPDVRGLGSRRRPVGREVHAIDGRRTELDAADPRERRPELGDHPVRRCQGCLPDGARVHRRLLRTRHLRAQHLCAHGLDSLSV
jgi:hypothetical protein